MLRQVFFKTVAVAAFGVMLLCVSRSRAETPAGGDTPEATFDLAVKAAEDKDWKTVIVLMTDESQETFAGGVAFGGMMMQGFAKADPDGGLETAKKIEEALAKHGLDKAFLKQLEGDATLKDPEAAMKKLVVPIKDRGQFVADMMEAFTGIKGFKNESPVSRGARLKDLATEGDAAKATIEYQQDGQERTAPVAFKKIDGKWRMDMTETMKSEQGGADSGGLSSDEDTSEDSGAGGGPAR